MEIQAEEGPPPPKFEKNKFVLKWFLGNFKCFKTMFFFKKKKKKITENWSDADPTLNGIFRYFFFFESFP